MADRVLLLAPSRGLGGGIERYISTVETALHQYQVPCQRLDLRSANRTGTLAKWQFVHEVTRAVRSSEDKVRLVVAHVNLLPAIYLAMRLRNFSGATVLFYGCEIWAHRRLPGSRVLHHPSVRSVAISNFSAGALAHTCRASILYPGVAAAWFDKLVDAGKRACRTPGEVNLITAFRLADWREKGLETILEAVHMLGDNRVRLTVCGTGPVPPPLADAVARHPWCQVVPDLTDDALAQRLADADLFVLSTRTLVGADAYGEGFGLVLLEAQLAGTPVIAPAYGGSNEAFQLGLTGLAPINETPTALTNVLRALVHDDRRRAEMGRAAAQWSRARFEPTVYSRHAVQVLLGDTTTAREGETGGET